MESFPFDLGSKFTLKVVSASGRVMKDVCFFETLTRIPNYHIQPLLMTEFYLCLSMKGPLSLWWSVYAHFYPLPPALRMNTSSNIIMFVNPLTESSDGLRPPAELRLSYLRERRMSGTINLFEGP